MRLADYIFFGTTGIAIISIVSSFIFLGYIPTFLTFWWAPLVPVSMIRVFFPKSKITYALEKERVKNQQITFDYDVTDAHLIKTAEVPTYSIDILNVNEKSIYNFHLYTNQKSEIPTIHVVNNDGDMIIGQDFAFLSNYLLSIQFYKTFEKLSIIISYQ